MLTVNIFVYFFGMMKNYPKLLSHNIVKENSVLKISSFSVGNIVKHNGPTGSTKHIAISYYFLLEKLQ